MVVMTSMPMGGSDINYRLELVLLLSSDELEDLLTAFSIMFLMDGWSLVFGLFDLVGLLFSF
jgi:hypothetical protein